MGVLHRHSNYVQIPLLNNMELDWMDYKGKEIAELKKKWQNWEVLGGKEKTVLVLGSLFMSICGYIFYFFDNYGATKGTIFEGYYCFGDFNIRTPSEKLSFAYVVRTLGIIGFVFFCLSVCMLKLIGHM